MLPPAIRSHYVGSSNILQRGQELACNALVNALTDVILAYRGTNAGAMILSSTRAPAFRSIFRFSAHLVDSHPSFPIKNVEPSRLPHHPDQQACMHAVLGFVKWRLNLMNAYPQLQRICH